MFHQELQPASSGYQEESRQYSQDSHLRFLLEAHKNVLQLRAQNNNSSASYCLPAQDNLKPFGASAAR